MTGSQEMSWTCLLSTHASVTVVTLLIDTFLFVPNIQVVAQVSLATSLHLDVNVVWVCASRFRKLVAQTRMETVNMSGSPDAFDAYQLRYVALCCSITCCVQNEDYSWILLRSLVLLMFSVMLREGCVAQSVEPRWSIMIFHPTWTPSQNRRCTCFHLAKSLDHVMCRHNHSCTSVGEDVL